MKPRSPDPTCRAKGKRLRTLRGLVRHYILTKRPRAQHELDSFSKQSFEEALERAALARHENGKRFGHQTRLREPVLRKAADILLDGAKELHRCRSFDQLHKLIKEQLSGMRGLGELYYYDTALRISAPVHLLPKRVYLHRGTRDGARALGLDWRADWLDSLDLPRELAVLEPHEIEDFLCIYRLWLRPGMK